MAYRKLLTKSLAAVLVAALTATAPGLGCYEALANVAVGVNVGTGVQAVPGGAAGAGLSSLSAPTRQGSAMLASPNISLTGGLKTLPTVTPAAASLPSAGVSVLGAPVGASRVAPRTAGRGIAPAAVQAVGKSAPQVLGRAPVHGAVKGGVAAASPQKGGAPTLKNALSQKRAISEIAGRVSEMPASQAHVSGIRIMDRLLGRRSHSAAASPVPAGKVMASVGSGLSRSAALETESRAEIPAGVQSGRTQQQAAPRSFGRKALGFLLSLGTMGVGGGAVYGLHVLAATLLPGVFGVVPIATVWAISSGVFLLPVSLYARYRLGLRDSPRLKGVKLFNDLVTGAFLGAAAVAFPALASGSVLSSLTVALPLVAAGSFAASAAGRKGYGGGGGGIINSILAWMSLNLLAPLFGSVAASPFTLGSAFGLMALPAMTTIAFFLGSIILSAESGRQFSLPGGGKFRFPSYTWVMTGVVFALLTGYSPVWTNVAFGIWMFLGKTRLFNYLYLGVVGWTIATGFSAPVAFLAIAFMPERAQAWSEWALSKLIQRGQPAPSNRVDPVKVTEDPVERWPRFNNWLKTGAIIGTMVALGGAMSYYVVGISSFLINLGIGTALAAIPMIFSRTIIKKVMKATPMREENNPEIFGMMRDLMKRVNAERAEKGKKPLPMPEMVDVAMPVPNAFATGPTPTKAMVGVTYEMKDMTLNPERVREGLIRLLSSVDGQSDGFRVFRMAIRGSIPDIAESAGPREIVAALRSAEPAHLKALGTRALRGVLGHEMNHVLHRDILLGSISGAIASGISFSSYGVLWAVGHAKAGIRRLWDRLTKRAGGAEAAGRVKRGGRYGTRAGAEGRHRPQAVEPVTAAGGVATIMSLAKIFAALWAPVLATLLTMASSRTREHHADEGGALLTEDAQSLALGLGLLTSWRPRMGVMIPNYILPLLGAQAHIMTVNPFEQLHRADALPELSAASKIVVGKKDNFLFNLFITHPDTMTRIERLYKMALATKAKKERADK